MYSVWGEFIEMIEKQWQHLCRTMEPNEILANITALAVVLFFIIILTFYQPILMAIAVSITLVIGVVALAVQIGHKKLKDWVTTQCTTAKHAERVRTMERSRRLDDEIATISQSPPNGDLTPR